MTRGVTTTDTAARHTAEWLTEKNDDGFWTRSSDVRHEDLRALAAEYLALVSRVTELEALDLIEDDEVCACLNDTGSRAVRIVEKCERCGALMRSDAYADAQARLVAQQAVIDAARAVAIVWAVAAMDEWGTMQMDGRITAHPLSCVQAALAGESDPVQLGCDPDQFAAALAALATDDPYASYRVARAALGVPGE